MIWAVDARDFGLLFYNQALIDFFRTRRDMTISLGMRPQALFPNEEYRQRWEAYYTQARDEGG